MRSSLFMSLLQILRKSDVWGAEYSVHDSISCSPDRSRAHCVNYCISSKNYQPCTVQIWILWIFSSNPLCLHILCSISVFALHHVGRAIEALYTLSARPRQLGSYTEIQIQQGTMCFMHGALIDANMREKKLVNQWRDKARAKLCECQWLLSLALV